jgi:hypothetical protein
LWLRSRAFWADLSRLAVKAARVEAAWRTPNWNAGPTDAKLLVIVSLS